jgi:site-specific DNA-methyltransferase (adenine-specific)
MEDPEAVARWSEQKKAAQERAGEMGRHPSNLILDGSPEVVAMFPNTKSGKPGIMRKGTNDGACYGAESRAPGTPMTGFGDEGSAARFFHHFQPDTDPLFYHPKAGKADRAGSKHPTVKPVALMQYLIRHITPPGGTVLDPFAGSGTTAEAARREGFDCILMEAEAEYCDFLRQRFGLSRPGAAFDFSDLLGRDPDVPRSSETMFKEILG